MTIVPVLLQLLSGLIDLPPINVLSAVPYVSAPIPLDVTQLLGIQYVGFTIGEAPTARRTIDGWAVLQWWCVGG
jgi:hypothetical protein